MKKIINLLLALVLTANLAACWTEDIPEAGAARHQVTGLTATPGDEEVLLSWSMPEGWNPTDFIVYYTNTDSKTVTRRTGGLMNCTVTGLANGTQYTFYVQAVYGENISNYVGITGKPSTSRFPVTDLAAEAGDAYVTLTWSKPSTTVLSYTLSYYNEDATGDVTELPLDKDATAITLDNLVNDKNYYFSLVANYAKGTSEAATVKAMPTQAIPYSLDRDKAAKNQPITFTFNTADYPTATDVKWTFPGDVVKQGTVVKYGLGSVGTQTVKLSATINGNVRTWNLEVEIREYVVYSTDWAQDGSNYNGFKGSCPVFSPDGKTVYIITFNKVAGLYAFDLATGSEKWRYIPAAKSNSYNMLTVNPVTGDIYYGTTGAGQFYAVTAEGQLKWTFTEAGSMQSCSPAVNASGTVVYISDATGNTFGIDASSGSKIWSYAAGDKGCGLLVIANELLVGTTSNAIFLNAETGAEIAKVALGCTMVDNTGFAVSNDKTLAYFGAKSGYIGAVNLTSRTIHGKLLAGGGNANANDIYEPVVAPNGSVFAGSKRRGVQREGRPFGQELGICAYPQRSAAHQRIQLRAPLRRLRKPVLHHSGTGFQRLLHLRCERQHPRLVELRGQRHLPETDGRQQLPRRRSLFGVHRQFLEKRNLRRQIRRRRTGFELEHPRRRHLRLVLRKITDSGGAGRTGASLYTPNS